MMRYILVLIYALAVSPAALAHGDAPDAAKGVDYSKAEETAFGRAADPRKAKRTVRVDMTDQMRFLPANKGQVMHEMVLGTMDDLKKHAELMKKFPEMEHDEPYMAHVAPGKAGEI